MLDSNGWYLVVLSQYEAVIDGNWCDWDGRGHLLEVALSCRVSAIIHKNARIYGDYQLIIAINASTRQLTVQPIATSSVNAMFLS